MSEICIIGSVINSDDSPPDGSWFRASLQAVLVFDRNLGGFMTARIIPSVSKVIEVLRELGLNAREGTDFHVAVDRADVEFMLNSIQTDFDWEQFTEFTPIMCKEYGEDEDWIGIQPDDLDENGHLDEDWHTFELWLSLAEHHPNHELLRAWLTKKQLEVEF